MKIDIDWEKINTNYKNSVKEFLIWLSKKYNNKFLLEMNCIPNENTICYCDLEEFFDDNGYRIYYTLDNRYDISKYNEYDILEAIFISEVIDKLIIKQQAIYKVFEILEQQCKE